MEIILSRLKTTKYVYGFFLVFIAILTIASIIAIWSYMAIFGSIFLVSGTSVLITQGMILPIMRERRRQLLPEIPAATQITPYEDEPVSLPRSMQEEEEEGLEGCEPGSWQWKLETVLELLNQRDQCLKQRRGLDPELTDSRIVERVWGVSRTDSHYKQCVYEYRTMLDSIKTPKWL